MSVQVRNLAILRLSLILIQDVDELKAVVRVAVVGDVVDPARVSSGAPRVHLRRLLQTRSGYSSTLQIVISRSEVPMGGEGHAAHPGVIDFGGSAEAGVLQTFLSSHSSCALHSSPHRTDLGGSEFQHSQDMALCLGKIARYVLQCICIYVGEGTAHVLGSLNIPPSPLQPLSICVVNIFFHIQYT